LRYELLTAHFNLYRSNNRFVIPRNSVNKQLNFVATLAALWSAWGVYKK